MSIEAIAAMGSQAIAPAADVTSLSGMSATQSLAAAPAGLSEGTLGTSFDGVLSSLRTLNTQMIANQESVKSLALGGTDNLHQVLMGMEQTRLGFDLMLAVRNKLLDAYQELMRMQV